jgi:hypothetical protein
VRDLAMLDGGVQRAADGGMHGAYASGAGAPAWCARVPPAAARVAPTGRRCVAVRSGASRRTTLGNRCRAGPIVVARQAGPVSRYPCRGSRSGSVVAAPVSTWRVTSWATMILGAHALSADGCWDRQTSATQAQGTGRRGGRGCPGERLQWSMSRSLAAVRHRCEKQPPSN